MKHIFPKILSALFLTVVILQTFFFVGFKLVVEPALADDKFDKPVLEVTIPGLNFSDAKICEKDSTKYCVSWISEYIIAIYRFGVGIAGVITAVVLAFAGFLWASAAGSADKIGQAKNYLTGGLSGLVLIMVSYLLLYTINPQLTTFAPMEIKKVEPDSEKGKLSRYEDCFWAITNTTLGNLATPTGMSSRNLTQEGYAKVDVSICETKKIQKVNDYEKDCVCKRKALGGCQWKSEQCIAQKEKQDTTGENCSSLKDEDKPNCCCQAFGSGNCQPITSGACSPEDPDMKSLFSEYVDQASAICLKESGNVATAKSGTDRCSNNGNPVSFSFGLFQINLKAHGNKIASIDCTGLYEVTPPSSGGSAVDRDMGECLQRNGEICMIRNCKIKEGAIQRWNECTGVLLKEGPNKRIAAEIFNAAGNKWNAWGANRNCGF